MRVISPIFPSSLVHAFTCIDVRFELRKICGVRQCFSITVDAVI